jgi:hypothetical protein
MVSKINATCYRPQVHRHHAHQTFDDYTDFIDDDVATIFRDEVCDNID